MSTFLPMFPLQLVVFPGEHLNLHIFEPRYKQLIQECEEEGITFGIPAYIDGKVMDTGTEIKLLKIEKRYENGELDVKTKGLGIFNIRQFYKTAPDKLYSAADVERLPVQEGGDFITAERILELIQELFSLLNVDKDLPETPNQFRTYDWAHQIGFSLQHEYQLLCMPEEIERQQFMLVHLENILPRVKEIEEIRRKAQMNGHFRNVIPPNV